MIDAELLYNRAQYLVRLSSYKKNVFCSYWQECESEFQTNTTTFKITNARNMSKLIETQNQCQQKCKETICNQCVLYEITITSKFAYYHHLLNLTKMCIGRNYPVLIITKFIFTNTIKYDMYLVYFLCINNHVISMQLTRNNATSIW